MRKGTKFVLSIFGAIALMLGLAACGGTADAGTTHIKTPRTLVGEWYQINETDSGVQFHASIYPTESIQMEMLTRDGGSTNYWMGSFESSKNPRYNFTTTSLADPDAQKWMRNSLFGSQDSSKAFRYENGVLSFKFTMLGKSNTIKLRQRYALSAVTPSPSRSTYKPSAKTTTRTPTPARTTKSKTPSSSSSSKK